MPIRILGPGDAVAFQDLRLRALQEWPSSFASSHQEEVGAPIAEVAARLAPTATRVLFGAFGGSELIGTLGIEQETLRKLAHKAYIWGVYVEPATRRQGVGGELVTRALDYAARVLQVRQVNLGVNASNVAAIALYERLGFERYGLERDCMLLDGVPHDEVLMVRFLPERPR